MIVMIPGNATQCGICYAVVLLEHLQDHHHWHARLARAVEDNK